MSPSLEYLERCAAETGYRVTPLEKVVRLGKMAADVARHAFLSSVHALEGGTAHKALFPGEPAEAARIASHPALLWKIENVRAHWELHGRQASRSGPNDAPTEG